MYIDAHCHLADLRFREDLDQVLERSEIAGISGWIQGGIGPEDWVRQVEIQARFGRGIIPVFGLHPWWVSENPTQVDSALGTLQSELSHLRALGEMGLDYSSKYIFSMTTQKAAFERQLAFAKDCQLPVILHLVHCHADASEILRRVSLKNGGIIHSFSGSLETADAYIRLGFHVSVSGAVLRPGYKDLKKAIPAIPLEKLVIETDCPDRDRNEPAQLVAVAQAVGDLKGVPAETVLKTSTENVKMIFRL